MTDLANKVAWVTGAGSEIGEAAARVLARAGATTVLTGRRIEPLERVAGQIRADGCTALVHAGDLTDSSQTSAIAASISKAYGRLDILVNNAGLNIRERSWSDLTPPRIDTLLRGNLSAAFYAAAAALPLMRAQGWGDDPYSILGRPPHQSGKRPRLHGRQACRDCDQPQHQHGGIYQWHTLDGNLPG